MRLEVCNTDALAPSVVSFYCTQEKQQVCIFLSFNRLIAGFCFVITVDCTVFELIEGIEDVRV
jgi:hypothetical protein